MRLIDADYVLDVLWNEVTDNSIDNKDVLDHIIATTPTAFDLSKFEYVLNLNLIYIDKILNTPDISKKKACNYIREHLQMSMKSCLKIDWSDNDGN